MAYDSRLSFGGGEEEEEKRARDGEGTEETEYNRLDVPSLEEAIIILKTLNKSS